MSIADEPQPALDVPAQDPTEALSPTTAPLAAVSPGAKLRAAREAKGMSMEQVIKETLLTSHYLKALEADDYDALPGTTFVRGYLRRYAGVVGLSANELVAEFDAIWLKRTVVAAPVDEAKPYAWQKEAAHSVRVGSQGSVFARTARQFPLATLLSWGSVLLLLALLVGSLFWNGSAPDSSAPEASEAIDLSAAIAPTPVTTVEQALPTSADAAALPVTAAPGAAETVPNPEAEIPTDAPAASAPATPVLAPAEAANTGTAPVAKPLPNTVIPVTAAPSTSAKPLTSSATPVAPAKVAPPSAGASTLIPVTTLPASAAAPVPPRSDTLSFSFTGKSWISVRDATGQELVYGLKNAGQAVTVTGQPPFAINIGSVKDTQMSRNGTPINLKPYTRGEIASFRLGR